MRYFQFLFACAAVVVGCNSESTPPASSPSGSTSDNTAPAASANAPSPAPASSDTASAPDFYGCQKDADCIAVEKNGCCPNGTKEAVNAAQADAYKKSFTCPPPRPFCPMYKVNDSRTPVCNPAAHRCEMVQK